MSGKKYHELTTDNDGNKIMDHCTSVSEGLNQNAEKWMKNGFVETKYATEWLYSMCSISVYLLVYSNVKQ